MPQPVGLLLVSIKAPDAAGSISMHTCASLQPCSAGRGGLEEAGQIKRSEVAGEL